MNDLNKEMLAAGIRWVLTLLGAWLAKKGLADNDMVTTIVGGAPALAALAWSIMHKQSTAKKVEDALYTPVPSTPRPSGTTGTPGTGVVSVMIGSLLVASFLSGCTTTQKRVSYQTLASIQTAVDASMKVFAKAYVDGKVSEANKVKVFAIHEQYRACFATAVNAAKANYQALPAQDLVNIATSLVSTINTLTGKATQ